MCRSDHDSGGKRRCPCDTSEARRLRGYNKRDRTAYASLAVKPPEPRLLAELDADASAPFTVESVKQDIVRLKTDLIGVKTHEDRFRVRTDTILNQIGTGIEYIAETKYGAPTDIQLKDATDADAEARANELSVQAISPKVIDLYKKRNVAIKAALEEVGVKFTDPKTLEFSDDSHSGAAKTLKEAITYYPQKWVDNSNDKQRYSGTELRVKHSLGRAHYINNAPQKTTTTKQALTFVSKPADWVPDHSVKSEADYVELNEKNEWVDPRTGEVQFFGGRGVQPGYKGWAVLSYQYTDIPGDAKWEKVTLKEQVYDADTKEYKFTGQLINRWRRPKKTRTKEITSNKAEITISNKGIDAPLSQNSGFRVALHEFAHRVEYTTPEVKFYERAFLERRIGVGTSNREEMLPINSRSNELGYKDNFTNHYMGRSYDGEAYEILSMGMEAIFSGSQGGLVGAGNYKPDADYKRFILGILASSAKPK
jgi:hypothetical protein